MAREDVRMTGANEFNFADDVVTRCDDAYSGQRSPEGVGRRSLMTGWWAEPDQVPIFDPTGGEATSSSRSDTAHVMGRCHPIWELAPVPDTSRFDVA